MFRSCLVLCVLFAVAVCGKKCIVPFGSITHWDVFWPLVFHENGSLYQTELINDERTVVVPAGNTAYISCGPNYIKQTSRMERVVTSCVNGQFSSTELGLSDAKDLACDLRSVQEILATVAGCPEEKTAVRFGFVHPVDNSAHITGEACYCTKEGRTLFAHVRLGSEQFTTLEITNRDFFKQAYPESRYKVDFMKAFRLDEFNSRLKTAIGHPTVPLFKMANFIDQSLLWNAQLASTKRLAWNYFIMHQDLQNIKRIKQDIAALNEDIDVYIGSHGVTTLLGADGSKVPIYLDGKKFPVPEVVWILVKKGNKATGFVLYNDPTLSEHEITENVFCHSKCEAISWLTHSRNLRPNKGGLLCCDYEEMKHTITEIPQLSDISELYI